jgi:hypothetical protein
VQDEAQVGSASKTWFELTPIGTYGPYLHLNNISNFFPFSTTSGQVLSAPLARLLCRAIPLVDWKGGADHVLGHGALIACEGVHYLHSPLSVYRLHGANSQIVDGRFTPRAEAKERWPKSFAFLESLIDSLNLDSEARAERLAFMQRLGRSVRALSRTIRYVEPLGSFILLDRGSTSSLVNSLAALLASSHPRTEIVVVSSKPDRERDIPTYLQHESVRVVRTACEDPLVQWMRAGVESAQGDYLSFQRAGNRPDQIFMERHVYFHRYVAMCGLTCSDLRIVDRRDVLVHVGLFDSAGLWKGSPMIVRPLGIPFSQPGLPSTSSCVLRRTAILMQLLESLPTDPADELTAYSEWLLVEALQGLQGISRINECLSSQLVEGSDAASYFSLLSPRNDLGEPIAPDPCSAALFISDFVDSHADIVSRSIGASDTGKVVDWLRNGLSRENRNASTMPLPAADSLA